MVTARRLDWRGYTDTPGVGARLLWYPHSFLRRLERLPRPYTCWQLGKSLSWACTSFSPQLAPLAGSRARSWREMKVPSARTRLRAGGLEERPEETRLTGIRVL